MKNFYHVVHLVKHAQDVDIIMMMNILIMKTIE